MTERPDNPASQRNEQRYRLLVESVNITPWEADPATWQFTYVGPQAFRLLGYPVDDWYAPGFWECHVHPDDRGRACAERLEISTQPGDYELEYRMLAADGQVLWIRDMINLGSTGDREAIIRGVLIDVSLHRQAKISLAEEHSLLRTLIDNLPDYIYVKDRESRLVISNAAHARVLGVAAPEEIAGKTDFDFFPAELAQKYHADEQKVIQTGEALVNLEEPAVDGLGNRKWVSSTKVPLRDSEGKIVGLVGMSRDMTEWKRAQNALRDSEDRFRRLSEATFEGILINDNDTVLDANHNFARMHGYALQEIIGKRVLETFVAPECWDLIRDRIASKYEKPYEAVHVRKDGRPFPVEICGKTNQYEGRDVRVVAVRDITERHGAEQERRKLERQMRQAQVLRSLGVLAGGIAHDFNNLMTAIIVYCELLLDRLNTSDPVARQVAEDVRNVANRAASLCRQLLAFGRKTILQPTALDLTAVINDLGPMLRSVLGEGIELITKLDPEVGPVNADPVQIQQIIVNLAFNARDAMPEGGRLTIETADVEVEQDFARRHVDLQPGPHVRLTVCDTGCGMDEQVQARIFEPFFTTKEHGRGTGLGLSTVYGIVKQSGGDIAVDSKPGRGATFTIYLPQVKKPRRKAKPPEDAGEIPHGSETVLLVDDEEVVRRSVSMALGLSGYRVLLARRGTEALQVVAQHPGPIHLLVTDVVMPGLSGRELAECLAIDQPDMKVLYISGYTDEEIARHHVPGGGPMFLQKPFTPEALARKVRELLASPKK
jgi:PAS domain S-box-containing protein